MTELAMSDANPPARVSLLTLVSFRGEGIIWETPGQFRVSSRQSGSDPTKKQAIPSDGSARQFAQPNRTLFGSLQESPRLPWEWSPSLLVAPGKWGKKKEIQKMSYLYVKWNSFGAGPQGVACVSWLKPSSYISQEELQPGTQASRLRT